MHEDKANCDSPVPASKLVVGESVATQAAKVGGHGSFVKDMDPNMLELSDFDSKFWVRPESLSPEVSASSPLGKTPSPEVSASNPPTTPGDDIKGNLKKPDLLADTARWQATT